MKVIAGLVLLMLVISMGCNVTGEKSFRLNSDREISIKEGQTFSIELEANPPTGYVWELSGLPDNRILRQVGVPDYIRESERIGAGGIRTYRFEGLREGRTNMTFTYRRPWEKEKPPAEKYTVKVVVY